jgi:glycosyltransferase involved in cell wall biosynthesis
MMVSPWTPTLLTVHDPLPHPGQSQPKGVLGRAAAEGVRRLWLRRARLVVVHGEALRGEMKRACPKARVETLPFGHLPEAAPLPPPTRPAVVFFGRLERYKGLRVLVEAMGRVRDERPDIELVVAGRGEEAGWIRTRSGVTLLEGYLPETAIPELLRRASLVALPYTQASQSAVGPIALAHGVPIVVSDAGSLADLALNQSFVAPAGDAAALAEVILHHVDDGPEVRRRALERAHDFSWRAVAERSLRLYGTLSSRTDE